jgi:hypothetical protein
MKLDVTSFFSLFACLSFLNERVIQRYLTCAVDKDELHAQTKLLL